jgi:PAS domain S-box-containing protein
MTMGAARAGFVGPFLRRMQRVICRVILSYALAVAAVGVMLAVRAWLWPAPGTAGTAALFMPAVVLAAWIGGLGPGLLATGLAVVGTAYFFGEPVGSLAVHDRVEASRLLVFAVAGTLVSLLAAAMHRSRRLTAATERQLRESQDRYRAFLANSSEAIWRFELDEPVPTDLPADGQIDRMYRHGYLAECNDAMARMYGLASADQLVGKRLTEFHVRERPENVEFTRAFVAAGYRLSDVESVKRDVDGRIRYFSNSLTGQVEDGRLMRAWGTQRDVTALREATAALTASEARFRTLADTVPALVWIAGPDKARTFYNKPWLAFTGRSLEQELGDGWTASVHPDDFDRVVGTYNRAFDVREPFTLDYRLRRADGEYRWILARGIPRYASGDGTFEGYIGICVDITDRREAEQALRRSEDQLRLVTDSLPSLVAYVDRDLRYRFNNRAYVEWFGPDLVDLRGRSVRDVIGEGAFEQIRPHAEAALRGERVTYEQDLPYLTGGTRHVEATYVPHVGPDGRVEGYVALINDVTPRRRRLAHERFLAEATALLASSLDYDATLQQVAALAVPTLADWCAIDMRDGDDGRVRRLAIKHADPAKEQLARELWAKYPPRAGDPGLMAVLDTAQPLLASAITDEQLEQGARDPEHLRVLRELGLRSAMVVPLVARGRTLGAMTFVTAESGRSYRGRELGFATDLARRAAMAVDNARLYREAQDANRTKDEFLAVVSHELRTPLNAILGWAQLLRARPDEDLVHGLETIERNAKAQAELIDDLLDISRIITGKLRLDVREVDLVPVLDAAIESVRPAADAKGIALRATFDPRAGHVAGDGNRLQQVAWNLLSNAIKFTPRGGHVALRLHQVDGHVEVRVADTGQGIDAAFLPYVFQRFRQADASSTRQHGGLGLGLSIVRHLVELHGGTVSVESAGVAQGSTFAVRLPAMTPPGADAAPRAHLASDAASATTTADDVPNGDAPPPPRGRLEGVKVLVVDDDPDARDLLSRILRVSLADVTTAGSVADALAAIERSRPDVLLSDIGMPGEDGYALIRQLRQREAHGPGGNGEPGARIPAVALTAFAGSEDRRRALTEGFQMHVPKPVEATELTAAVATLVGR